MTTTTSSMWRQHFQQADAYRYNSASIRVRVIDPSFDGMSRDERDTRVERFLDMLPDDTQRDIVTLLTMAPSEVNEPSSRSSLINYEFEHPSPSIL